MLVLLLFVAIRSSWSAEARVQYLSHDILVMQDADSAFAELPGTEVVDKAGSNLTYP